MFILQIGQRRSAAVIISAHPRYHLGVIHDQNPIVHSIAGTPQRVRLLWFLRMLTLALPAGLAVGSAVLVS